MVAMRHAAAFRLVLTSPDVSASRRAPRLECLPSGNCIRLRRDNNARWNRARAGAARLSKAGLLVNSAAALAAAPRFLPRDKN